VRIYRNVRDIYFTNPIHEVVEYRIEASNWYAIQDTNIFIHHVGYELPKEGYIAKLQRNQDILDSIYEPDDYLREYKEAGKKVLTELGFTNMNRREQ
jgi:hypothetical protein